MRPLRSGIEVVIGPFVGGQGCRDHMQHTLHENVCDPDAKKGYVLSLKNRIMREQFDQVLYSNDWRVTHDVDDCLIGMTYFQLIRAYLNSHALHDAYSSHIW